MLAAASIQVMDALCGLVARNDAEWSIGESFWDARGVEIEACANFPKKIGIRELFPVPGKITARETNLGLDALGSGHFFENRAWPDLDAMSVPEALT